MSRNGGFEQSVIDLRQQMKALLGRVSAPSRRLAPRCADNNRDGESTADCKIASNGHQQEKEDLRESRGNFADQSCNGSRAGETAEPSESMRDAHVQGTAGKIGEGNTSKREFLGNRESERERVCKFVLEIIAQERRRENHTFRRPRSQTSGGERDRCTSTTRRGLVDIADLGHNAARCEEAAARSNTVGVHQLYTDDEEEVLGQAGHGRFTSEAEADRRTEKNRNEGREQEASQHVAGRYPGLGDKVEIRGKQDKDETLGINERLPLRGIDSLRKGVKDGSFPVEGPPNAAKPDDNGSRGLQSAGDREMKIVGAGLQTSAAWGLVQDVFDYSERDSESPPRSGDKRIIGSPKSLSSGLPSPLLGDAPARAPSASPGGEESALGGLIGLEESKPCLHDFAKGHVAQGVEPLSSTLLFPQQKRLSAERLRHVKDAARSPDWIRETIGAHQPGSNKARVTGLSGEGDSLLKRMESTPSFNHEPQFGMGISFGAERPSERKTGVPQSFSPIPLEEYSNNPQVRTKRVTKTNSVEMLVADLQKSSRDNLTKIVISLCKHLQREAKQHLKSVKAVMQASRQKAAKLVCNEEAMKARIEELERLLLVAIESSCSKDNMAGSLQALSHIRGQRQRVLEAEKQCNITNDQIIALKKQVAVFLSARGVEEGTQRQYAGRRARESAPIREQRLLGIVAKLREEHTSAQTSLAAALAELAASSEKETEHYDIAQQAIAGASAAAQALASAQLEREELQTQNHLLQQQLAESQAQAKAALERASKAEQLASDARQLAVAKDQLAAAAIKKLQIIGMTVPDLETVRPPIKAKSQWDADEDDVLPAPTTFLRQNGGDGGVGGGVGGGGGGGVGIESAGGVRGGDGGATGSEGTNLGGNLVGLSFDRGHCRANAQEADEEEVAVLAGQGHEDEAMSAAASSEHEHKACVCA